MKRYAICALACALLLICGCDYIPPDIGVLPFTPLPVLPNRSEDAERVFSAEETALYPLAAYVSASATDLKTEADNAAETITQLISGAQVTIVNASGEWYGVNTQNLSGFVRIDAVRASDEMPATQKRDAGGLINVRMYYGAVRSELVLAKEGAWGAPIYAVNVLALTRRTAQKLAAAAAELERMGCGLKVIDAYRDRAAQARLLSRSLSHVEITRGTAHRAGAAVDVVLTDAQGREKPMPSPLYAGGVAEDPEAANNARILREAMQKHGFTPNPDVWWHFEDVGALKMPISNTLMAEFMP